MIKELNKMFCSQRHCEQIQHAVAECLFPHVDLNQMLKKCYSCYFVSKSSLSKKTSHVVDVVFVEILIKTFEKRETPMNRFEEILNDLKKSISQKNCLSREDEEAVGRLIAEAVKKGEIFALGKTLTDDKDGLHD